MNGRYYDDEERAFLRQHIPGRSFGEMAAMFNAWNTHFPEFEDRIPRPPITAEQVKGFAGRYGVQTGRDTKFKKGQEAFNKGRKHHPGWRKSSTVFKKGNTPLNRKEIGDERTCKDGYLYVKIQDYAKNKNWKAKHILVWEQANGPVPKDHVVIFGDGNKKNIAPDNLILITRAQLVRLNQQKLIGASVELTKLGILTANLITKVAEKTKAGKKRRARKEANNEL